MSILEYKNAENTVIAWSEDGGLSTIIVEAGSELFAELVARGPSPYTPPPPPNPEAILAEKRSKMVATRRQVRLALGEAICNAMDAYAEDPLLPWAMREQIKSSHEWRRTAPEIDEFSWLLGLSPEQVDDLFELAMTL